jgi:riboflavin biosynthesis pyrimidine reductase
LLKKFGVKIYEIPLDKKKMLDLNIVLLKIKNLGFSRILLEAGIKLTTSFFKKRLINDFKIFISDTNISSNGTGNLKKYFNTFLKNKKPFNERVYLFGDNLITYKIR